MRALEVQGKQEMALREKPLPSRNLTCEKLQRIDILDIKCTSFGIKHECGWRMPGCIPDYEWGPILNTSIFFCRDDQGIRRVQLAAEADVPHHHRQQALLQGRAPPRRHARFRRHAGEKEREREQKSQISKTCRCLYHKWSPQVTDHKEPDSSVNKFHK